VAVDRATCVFFDASCLYAAAQPPAGGSARLLRLCRLGWFSGWTSRSVLIEVERNLRRKASVAALGHYERLLRLTPLAYASIPADPVWRYPGVNAKDAHVYAAARACAAHFLITLGRPFAVQVNTLAGNPNALSPGDFLQQALPGHPDYPADPEAGQAGRSQ
jgi:hypothetical protein